MACEHRRKRFIALPKYGCVEGIILYVAIDQIVVIEPWYGKDTSVAVEGQRLFLDRSQGWSVVHLASGRSVDTKLTPEQVIRLIDLTERGD